jgi:large subunit ribosomal protein L23
MKNKKNAKKTETLNPKFFDLLLSPVVTEKSTAALEQNKITLKVRSDATKITVKQAVEAIFNVTVLAVNIVNTKGKTKRFRGVVGRKSDVKKAIVTLKEGDYVDFTIKA